MLSTSTPALSYWLTPHTTPPKIPVVIKQNVGAPKQSSSGKGPHLLPVADSLLLSRPLPEAPGSPESKQASSWEAAHSVHTLTHAGPPWVQAVTWHGLLNGLQRL